MKTLTPLLMCVALSFAGQATAQDAKPGTATDKGWTERVVGNWRFEHRQASKDGTEQSERSEIRFGKDGRYSATTVITNAIEPVKLQASGTYRVTAIDGSRARIEFVHESKDPSVRKDELTETVEVTGKDKSTLLFPDNAILKSIP